MIKALADVMVFRGIQENIRSVMVVKPPQSTGVQEPTLLCNQVALAQIPLFDNGVNQDLGQYSDA